MLTNKGIPYPEDTDQVAAYPVILKSLADALAGLTTAALTFRAGYQSYSALFPCSVTKLGRLVVAQGLIGATGGGNLPAANVAVADLAAAYRPSQDLYLSAVAASATGENRLIINADGSVRINNELASPYVSFAACWMAAN